MKNKVVLFLIAAVALFVLPLIAQYFGNAWVRIIDLALLYVMLALGLNIVVGYAGLLDLGYVAFFAVGAYLTALLTGAHVVTSLGATADPDFVLHLNFYAAVPLVVFLGDSLTAGYGLEAGEALPALLEKRLAHEGMKIRAINAGVSGDTSAGGLRRLDWLLAQKPDVVLVELGANDGLRGLPLEQTEENLREIMASCRRAGATVVLAGMMIPTNYGPDYSRGFAKIYPKLARELSVPLVPFLLSSVAGRADLNQEDGIHPTAKGDEIVADNVLPFLRGALTERGKVGARGHSTKR